jgi:hypothetical protein
MGKSDLALVQPRIPIGGDKEQVAHAPGGGIGPVGRGPLFDDQMAQNAAQDHHRQLFLFKFDKEDAPGLAILQRAQLVNAADFDRIFIFQAQFGRAVLKGQVVKAILLQGPVQLFFQVREQLFKAVDGSQFGTG